MLNKKLKLLVDKSTKSVDTGAQLYEAQANYVRLPKFSIVGTNESVEKEGRHGEAEDGGGGEGGAAYGRGEVYAGEIVVAPD